MAKKTYAGPPIIRGSDNKELEWETPKKGKLRIMPISDSPWAPTGFGTNTRNVSAMLIEAGHHIGYAGCQNPSHSKYETEWPLGQTEKTVVWENLPIMHAGQERFGEKSFPTWCKNFKPDIIWTHLDFQMFQHVASFKKPKNANIPLYNDKGKLLTRINSRFLPLLAKALISSTLKG